MPTRRRYVHVLLVILAVALVTALTRVPKPPVNPIQIDGRYSRINGFTGTGLKLKDGRYSLSFNHCEGSELISEGSYQVKDSKLILTDSKSGETREFTLIPDGLEPVDPDEDLIKTFDAAGNRVPCKRLIHGPFSTQPAFAPELVANGKKLYLQLCTDCHGTSGTPESTSMNPPPTNLVRPESYKHGTELVDLYRSIALGHPGTAMVPYRNAVDDKIQLWELSYYVQSLQKGQPRKQSCSQSRGNKS